MAKKNIFILSTVNVSVNEDCSLKHFYVWLYGECFDTTLKPLKLFMEPLLPEHTLAVLGSWVYVFLHLDQHFFRFNNINMLWKSENVLLPWKQEPSMPTTTLHIPLLDAQLCGLLHYLWPLRHLPLGSTTLAKAYLSVGWFVKVMWQTQWIIDWGVKTGGQHLPAAHSSILNALTTGSRALTPSTGLPSEERAETWCSQ